MELQPAPSLLPFIPFKLKINTYKLIHAIHFCTSTLLSSVIEIYTADPNNLEDSLKIREIGNPKFVYNEYFNEQEKDEIHNVNIGQLNLKLLNKVAKAIFSTLEEEIIIDETEQYTDSLIEWKEEIERNFNQIHTIEELYTGLNDINILLTTTMEMMSFRRILNPVDSIRIHHRIDKVIADVKGFVLVTPQSIWQPNQPMNVW